MKSKLLFILLQVFASLILGILGIYLVEPISGFTFGIPETLLVFHIFGLIGILIVGYFQCKKFEVSNYFSHAAVTSVLWFFITALLISFIIIFILDERFLLAIPIIIGTVAFNLQIIDKRKSTAVNFK
jgi:hypothetical protein